jgi:glycosyltransferase involved in cell wall biosynthesis
VTIQAISAGEALAPERGSVLVSIPLEGLGAMELEGRQALLSVASVLAQTARATPLLLVAGAALLEQISEQLDGDLPDRTVLGLAPGAGGQTAAVNAAIRASSPGDLAIVAPGVEVGPGWLERLQAAARSDATVASATPLSLGTGGVPLFEHGLRDIDAERLAGDLAGMGPALRPRIASMGPGCVYVRRGALELVGPLDESPELAQALTVLARRTMAAGMIHVAADDVLVRGPSSPRRQRAGTASVSASEGEVADTLLQDHRGRLGRAIATRRTALRRLSVTIDGRALVPAVGGTQTYIMELIVALARAGEVALRVLVPPDLSSRAKEALSSVSDVELLGYQQAVERAPLTDVVHRPQAVFTSDDLNLLRLLGGRIVVGHQDLIAYHNYSYHRDLDAWRAYRRVTRLALAEADQVIFFSEHARADALGEDLVCAARSHVAGIGAESAAQDGVPPEQPPGLSPEKPFLLCLGADYEHKNRPFALELAGALHELGWNGRLVLAGAHVPFGSSRERERELLARAPQLAELTVDLGTVDESHKRWLYRHARALLYPTLYEGFGLLPLEAARAGLPCLFAAQASLSEIAPGAATLLAWDARASAASVLPLLSDGPAREKHLARLREMPIPTWKEVAGELVAVYRRAVGEPSSRAAPRASEELARESHIVHLDREIQGLKATAQEYQDAYHQLHARVAGGLPLIDEGGLLSRAQQRGLMRVAGRRRLGGVLLAPFGLLGGLAPGDAGTNPPDASRS